MKPTKIAIAAAALAATFSGGFAVAGSFQTNSTTIAREVIITDAQQIVAPQVTYSFQGPVRNPQNETYFQIQLKLDQGTWNIPQASGGFPDPVLGSTNGNVALVNNAGNVISTANAIRIDGQTLKATFRVPAGPGENNARVVFNAAGVHAAAGAAPTSPAVAPNSANLIRISGLKSVVGDVLECDVSIRNITGSVTQYPNISDLSYTAGIGDESPASEHKYPGSQNSGPVASFPTNLLVAGTADALVATQDYARQGMYFKGGLDAPNVTSDGKAVRLGIVNFSQRANGYDADLRTVYGTATPDVEVTTRAERDDGTIELRSLDLALAGSFSENARFWLAPQTTGGPNACEATAPNGNTSVLAGDKLSALLTYTGLVSKSTNLAVCYGVNGTNAIPTTAINATVVMNKALDGKSDAEASRSQEQNNSCKAQFNVGGGIRIDVRNYASYAKFGDSGTSSTLRIINNSETATADLYAQMIYADGTYGAWGQLPNLGPRAVANYSNRELESYMTNAAAQTNPFGNAAANYAASDQSTVTGHTKAGVGDRVRIVSTTGSTLRVQSYISSGPVMIDTSGAQGVDFEGLAAPNNGRAPTTDGQPISQDAVNGLSRR